MKDIIIHASQSNYSFNATENTQGKYLIHKAKPLNIWFISFENQLDQDMTATQIDDLLVEIKSGAKPLIKIKDRESGGNPVGIADEVDLESP